MAPIMPFVSRTIEVGAGVDAEVVGLVQVTGPGGTACSWGNGRLNVATQKLAMTGSERGGAFVSGQQTVAWHL